MQQPEKFTINFVINQSIKEYPSKIALADINGNGFTYSALGQRVESVKKFLKESGVYKGDKVAILSENQPNWGVAYFAITTMGAIAVPIMTEFREPDVHHILRHSGAKAIFVSEKFVEKALSCESSQLEIIVLIEDFSIIPAERKQDFIGKTIKDGLKELNKIKIIALKAAGLINEEIKEEDLASIVYTSGTTGHSKGVMLTHRNVVYDAFATIELVSIDSTDRLLSILPLAHTMECTLGLLLPIMAGATVYYLMKPPTATSLLPALKKIKPTFMLSVPLVIEKIYKQRIQPEIRKSKVLRSIYKIAPVRKKINKKIGGKLKETFGGELKMLCLGGAALAYEVEEFLREAGFPYAVGYGLTETSPLVTAENERRTRLGAAGRPIKGAEVKIDNPDPVSGEGEVLIKGEMVMKGYYKNPEKTKEVFTEDGWFRSGDLGYVDSEGYLFIRGRSKNVIIGSNGKNIYPEEIEGYINEMPYVLESLVVERDGKLIARVHPDYEAMDKEFGFYKLSPAQSEQKLRSIFDDILKYVNQRVPKFSKIHRIIEQREEFEKTPTKKIKRFLYQ